MTAVLPLTLIYVRGLSQISLFHKDEDSIVFNIYVRANHGREEAEKVDKMNIQEMKEWALEHYHEQINKYVELYGGNSDEY